MNEQAKTLPSGVIPRLGITMDDYQKLCLRAFENLPTDTSVTIGDVDSILTWCLPEYNRMKAAREGQSGTTTQRHRS